MKKRDLRSPRRGDMWEFTTNNGVIVRHVKSVATNGIVYYSNNGRVYHCLMPTWRNWQRGAELTSREPGAWVTEDAGGNE